MQPINLEQYGDYAFIRCPVCGHENVAPVSVNVIGGIGETSGIGTRIDASGTSVYATPTVGRGVKIELTFTCECRHSFVHTFHFHKGQTLLESQAYPFENGQVIWRD
jgi:hypothetical protein